MPIRKVKIAIFAVIILLFLVAAAFFLVGYFRPKSAGILIDTKPASFVYIDNEEAGKTPYKGVKNPGEYTVKLVPESFDKPLSTYETRINLVEGVETVVRREFAETVDLSSGEIVSFEKIGGEEIAIAVVSIPQGAQVNIDGIGKSQTPFRETNISLDDHVVELNLRGYLGRTIKIRPIKGYQLTLVSTLALDKQDQNPSEQVTPPVEESDKRTYVKILSTPVGFLRVRKEPSTLGEEVGQVDPGEQYELIDEDEKTGWFEIKFKSKDDEEEKTGWVSNQYAEKVVKGVQSPTPTKEP